MICSIRFRFVLCFMFEKRCSFFLQPLYLSTLCTSHRRCYFSSFIILRVFVFSSPSILLHIYVFLHSLLNLLHGKMFDGDPIVILVISYSSLSAFSRSSLSAFSRSSLSALSCSCSDVLSSTTKRSSRGLQTKFLSSRCHQTRHPFLRQFRNAGPNSSYTINLFQTAPPYQSNAATSLVCVKVVQLIASTSIFTASDQVAECHARRMPRAVSSVFIERPFGTFPNSSQKRVFAQQLEASIYGGRGMCVLDEGSQGDLWESSCRWKSERETRKTTICGYLRKLLYLIEVSARMFKLI